MANSTFEQATVSFERGDRFYLFTDGIYEVEDPTGAEDTPMLGYDAFVAILASCSSTPFRSVMSTIRHKLSSYTYEDDYTLIAIEATAR
jgi:serine phosphatase RsbU (regulator of sigma subunit)